MAQGFGTKIISGEEFSENKTASSTQVLEDAVLMSYDFMAESIESLEEEIKKPSQVDLRNYKIKELEELVTGQKKTNRLLEDLHKPSPIKSSEPSSEPPSEPPSTTPIESVKDDTTVKSNITQSKDDTTVKSKITKSKDDKKEISTPKTTSKKDDNIDFKKVLDKTQNTLETVANSPLKLVDKGFEVFKNFFKKDPSKNTEQKLDHAADKVVEVVDKLNTVSDFSGTLEGVTLMADVEPPKVLEEGINPTNISPTDDFEDDFSSVLTPPIEYRDITNEPTTSSIFLDSISSGTENEMVITTVSPLQEKPDDLIDDSTPSPLLLEEPYNYNNPPSPFRKNQTT